MLYDTLLKIRTQHKVIIFIITIIIIIIKSNAIMNIHMHNKPLYVVLTVTLRQILEVELLLRLTFKKVLSLLIKFCILKNDFY